MQKFLISWICSASLLATGCSTMKNWGENIPNIATTLEKTSLMYRPDVQQGNVISQEAVNRLRPGMTKHQIRYLMGTPILTDLFHLNRWDYISSMKKGSEARQQKQITLYFEDDRLIHIAGDLRPMPQAEGLEAKPETVFSVPDHEGKEKGFVTHILEKTGIKETE